MQLNSAKAYRCESCGAALSPDKSTCDYCGSHHNLPVWDGEEPTDQAPAAAPTPAHQRLAWPLVIALTLALIAVTTWFASH